MIASAVSTWMISMKISIEFRRCKPFTGPAALQIVTVLPPRSDAPPMRPPSMSGIAKSSAALAPFTLPPHSTGTPSATVASAAASCGAQVSVHRLSLRRRCCLASADRPHGLGH